MFSIYTYKMYMTKKPTIHIVFETIIVSLIIYIFFFFNFQSNEELDKLTVDEQLSDIERAVYLLR
jgi:hypothetical protein